MLPETLQKLCISTKFTHQGTRWKFGILRSVKDYNGVFWLNLFKIILPILVKFRLPFRLNGHAVHVSVILSNSSSVRITLGKFKFHKTPTKFLFTH